MNKKSASHVQRLVLSALFASLCCVATMVIKIPVPATGGYLNLGDAVVILCAWMLGPVYGALAAGAGTALADVFAGYVQYAPATFVIKALMAVCVWVVLRLFRKSAESKPALSFVFTALGGILAEAIMVAGYFFYEAVVLGYGIGAAAAIIPNVFQGIAGALAGTTLVELMKRTKVRERFL